MDVIIGRVPAIGQAGDRQAASPAPIEAKLLHVRMPRRRRDSERVGPDRAPTSPGVDPPGARVLVLLVPDAYRLPDDLNDSKYRIFLRVVRK